MTNTIKRPVGRPSGVNSIAAKEYGISPRQLRRAGIDRILSMPESGQAILINLMKAKKAKAPG